MGIEAYIGYTISPYNIGHLKETFEEIKKFIPDIKLKHFHINIYHESDIYYNNVGQIDTGKNYYKKLKEEIKEFTKYKRGLSPVFYLERRYLGLVENYLDTEKSPLPCRALSSSCFIDPYGNVYPCTTYNVKLGNIRETNFKLKKIWDSQKSNEIRRAIREGRCPGCWTPCEAYQTILGNLFRGISR